MSSSLNRATLIGNLTRDPEVRKTANGQSVASFSIATNRTYTDGQGQKKEQVDYHNIVAWARLAEICGQYLVKGKKIYVDGRIQNREWQGQDGQKRFRTEIVVENMIMLDRAGSQSGGTYAAKPGSTDSQFSDEPIAPSVPADDEIKLEDIPF